jgi:hypothetical protein
MNYIIISNYYPEHDYDISDGQLLRVVKNPYNIDNYKNGKLTPLNGQIWNYLITISDSFDDLRDLIFFHTFITNNSQTYHYAENSNKLSFEDEELEFVKDRSLIIDGGLIHIVDFNKFPLLMNCNQILEEHKIFKFIDYGKSFKKFLELKNVKLNGMSSKYNLYDLICLYVFAKNFEITHRLYRNSNIPLSFYITILEALIGEPASCNSPLHCNECETNISRHYKITLEKHFTQYFNQFKKIRKIRHSTFHGGSSFDSMKYLSDLLNSNSNWDNDKKYLLYQHNREEIECVIRILLTSELYNYCQN